MTEVLPYALPAAGVGYEGCHLTLCQRGVLFLAALAKARGLTRAAYIRMVLFEHVKD